MVRWIEGALERQRARKTILGFIIVFFFALTISIVSKIFNECNNIAILNFLNKFDTFFAIILGLLTVLGLILAFFAIKGFFERIRDFRVLLESLEELIRDVPTGLTIKILGYYLTFGVVTLGHTKKFREFIDALYDALRPGNNRSLEVLIEDPQGRQDTLGSYCKKYGFVSEALRYVFNKLCDQEKNLQLKAIVSNLDIEDLIENRNEVRSREKAAFIFNVYNELLLVEMSANVRYLSHDSMPDYHVVFSSQSPGIVFIPLIIPQARMEAVGNNAEIIGWRTIDPELLGRLDENFEYYWNHAHQRNEQDVIDTMRNIINKL